MTDQGFYDILSLAFSEQLAGVAQLVEQLICNQQVGGSSPSTSSTLTKNEYGSVPKWPKGADCKSVVSDFGGPNPPAPTKKASAKAGAFLSYIRLAASHFTFKISPKNTQCPNANAT